MAEQGPRDWHTPSRRRALPAVAVALGLAGILGIVAWQSWPRADVEATRPRSAPPPPDPRIVYQGPYANVRPDVQFVGDAACADCHADIAAAYKESAMGRSLRPVADVVPVERYDAGTHNPFERLGYSFHVERQGERIWHCQLRRAPSGESLLDFRLQADYVIGAGGRGRSYLTNRDGYLFQTAISWFADKQIWDLSPGFDAELLAGRPVGEACLFCHANRAVPVPEYRNRFTQPFAAGHSIGCERCHGPAEKHVREGGVLVNRIDPTIVNPMKLDHALREAVCQQCHLEGEGRVVRRGRRLDEFRPGLPLESVLAIFVHADEQGEKLVTHVEQMYLSQCFRGSAGTRKMGCISCHDPHRKIAAAERVAFYRQRCLACHGGSDCRAAPEARAVKQDSCHACHMPRAPVSDVAHVASTDHRIIRPGKAPPRRQGSGALEPFLPKGVAADDRELARDRGIAEVEAAQLNRAALERGLVLLEQASSDFPDDLEALEAWATALLGSGRPGQAADVLGAVLAKSPRRESALYRYAAACEAAGREAEGLDGWRRAVAINPWMASYRAHLASLLIRKAAWQELEPQAAAWLRLDPGNAEAHKAWIAALVKNEQPAQAGAALRRARALHPLNQGELQAWFEELQR